MFVGSSQRFTVTGSHTYARSGRFTITTTITHDGTTSRAISAVTVSRPGRVLTQFAALAAVPSVGITASAPASANLSLPVSGPANTAPSPAATILLTSRSAYQGIVDRLMGDLGNGLSAL